MDKEEIYGAYTDIGLLESKQYDLFDEARSKLGNISVFVYNLPEDYVNYLDKFGMVFPSLNLTLQSEVPRLKEIQEIPHSGKLWAASGHKYTWEKSMIYWACCSSSAISRCEYGWTCEDYKYRHIHHNNDSVEEPVNPMYFYEHLFAIKELEWGVV